MGSSSAKVHVSETGRLSLPVDMRREMGIEKGGVVHLEVVDGELRIRSVRQTVAALQKRVRDAGWQARISVDDFLDEKRADARREQDKIDRLARP
jgi:bifunctional DNA-binding transcriptional regulator/antitoxin component of YhaV-PrlF toxin-antitoxin module